MRMCDIMTGAFSPKDDAYYERFFNAVAELIPYLDDKLSPQDSVSASVKLTMTLNMYSSTQDWNKVSFKDKKDKLKKIQDVEQKAVRVINYYGLQNELMEIMDDQPEVHVEHITDYSLTDESGFSEDWQEANKWVNTMKKSTDAEIIAAANAIIDEGGRNEKEKADIETMKIALQYDDLQSVETFIQSFPQSTLKSEKWFNALKTAGPITANVGAGSATSEGLESKPKYSNPKKKKKEEKAQPVVPKELDFWRD